MSLNCGALEDSWESLGLQGDPTSPFWRKSVLNIHWIHCCWSWTSNTLATWCWERLKARGEENDRGWDGWMASPTWWTQIWANSRSWWWTGKPDVLQSMRWQELDMTELLNWTVVYSPITLGHFPFPIYGQLLPVCGLANQPPFLYFFALEILVHLSKPSQNWAEHGLVT